MKQFKVNSKNTVYNVFADSEVEAVNKVKEVEAKVGDASKGREIEAEDDLVVVTHNGKVIYKGLEDYEPMNRENWKWNEAKGHYELPGNYVKYVVDSKKVNDTIMVYSFETIKENGSKGSISVRASSEQEARVEAEKLLKREVNTFGVRMKLGKLFNSYKVGDSKVNDAYNIKPGAIFKSGLESRHGIKLIHRYIKIMKVGEKVLFNMIIEEDGKYETSYSDEMSMQRLKDYLSEGKYRPVNSLYDSKIVDAKAGIPNKNKIVGKSYEDVCDYFSSIYWNAEPNFSIDENNVNGRMTWVAEQYGNGERYEVIFRNHKAVSAKEVK